MLIIKHLGVTDFTVTCQAMQDFTAHRNSQTQDELWVTEHQAVYTIGLNRKQVIPPLRDDIPTVFTDRGGKITYHGLGQVVIYLLLDLTRRQLNIRSLVSILEGAVVELLADYGVVAHAKKEAPGVYVQLSNGQEAKIASLGLRVKNGCCYHGLSLNVEMDLSPFAAIDPCGYAGLKVTQLKDLGVKQTPITIRGALLEKLLAELN